MLYVFAFLGFGLHTSSLGALPINVLLFPLVLSTVLPKYQYSTKHGLKYCMVESFLLSYILSHRYFSCLLPLSPFLCWRFIENQQALSLSPPLFKILTYFPLIPSEIPGEGEVIWGTAEVH